MRMDKLTSRFQQAIADAQSLAVGRDHNLIEPAHLLVALIDQQGGSTRPLLGQAGVNVPLLRERLGEALDKLPQVSGQAGNVGVGNDLARLLNLTDKLAQQRGDAFIASELFVLAALEDGGELTEDDVKEHVRAHRARHCVPREVLFLDELPRNATGKILKRELKHHDEEDE